MTKLTDTEVAYHPRIPKEYRDHPWVVHKPVEHYITPYYIHCTCQSTKVVPGKMVEDVYPPPVVICSEYDFSNQFGSVIVWVGQCKTCNRVHMIQLKGDHFEA